MNIKGNEIDINKIVKIAKEAGGKISISIFITLQQ